MAGSHLATTSAAAVGAEPERISSSDQIVRDVVHGLYEGRYVAGQRLVEPDLMHRYGVSRSTVREAIKRLAAEGIVTTNPFRGAQIRQLSRTEAHNVLAIVELMIGLAARQAAARIDEPGARAHLTAHFEALMAFENERDSYDLVRARNRFYRAMGRIGGNKELERMLPSFQVHLIRPLLKLPRRARFADYRVMAAAIFAGDVQQAEAVARRHIRRTAEALNNAPDHAFAPEPQPTLHTLDHTATDTDDE